MPDVPVGDIVNGIRPPDPGPSQLDLMTLRLRAQQVEAARLQNLRLQMELESNPVYREAL